MPDNNKWKRHKLKKPNKASECDFFFSPLVVCSVSTRGGCFASDMAAQNSCVIAAPQKLQKHSGASRLLTHQNTDNAPHRSHNTVLPVTAHFSQETKPNHKDSLSVHFTSCDTQINSWKLSSAWPKNFTLLPALISHLRNLQTLQWADKFACLCICWN